MRLIDAEALKEEVKTIFCPDGYKTMMLERIDNAPELGYEDGILSVETATRRAIELEEAYNNGWSDGFSEGEDGRPKGEWIHLHAIGDYKCSICGAENLYKYTDEHERWIKTNSNFCPNCGAKMKGGTE